MFPQLCSEWNGTDDRWLRLQWAWNARLQGAWKVPLEDLPRKLLAKIVLFIAVSVHTITLSSASKSLRISYQSIFEEELAAPMITVATSKIQKFCLWYGNCKMSLVIFHVA
jgi:hypothetical protein